MTYSCYTRVRGSIPSSQTMVLNNPNLETPSYSNSISYHIPYFGMCSDASISSIVSLLGEWRYWEEWRYWWMRPDVISSLLSVAQSCLIVSSGWRHIRCFQFWIEESSLIITFSHFLLHTVSFQLVSVQHWDSCSSFTQHCSTFCYQSENAPCDWWVPGIDRYTGNI